MARFPGGRVPRPRLHFLAGLLVLAGVIFGVAGTSAPPVQAASITVGNDDAQRFTYDIATDFLIIDTNNPAPVTGELGTFKAWAANGVQFRFVLIEDTPDTNMTVKWIGPTLVGNGGVTIDNVAPLVDVQAGWYLGVYFPNAGAVSFNAGGAPAKYSLIGLGGAPSTGAIVPEGGTDARTYSMVAIYSGCTTVCYVDAATGNDANSGITPADAKATIQAAENDVDDGGTVIVAAGTYNEHLVVDHDITLQGANAGIAGNGARGAESIIDGGGTDAPVQLVGSGITLDGFTIQAGENGLSAGIHAGGADQFEVMNNVITDNSIGLFPGCATGCLIKDNLFDGNNRPGPAGGAGIYADIVSVGMTITGNEFKNHSTNNPVIFAATVAPNHSNVEFTENNIHDNLCGCSGVYALALSNATFARNTIDSDGASGIRFGGGSNGVDIFNNFLTGNSIGVNVQDDSFGFGANDDIQINNNDLSNNTTRGVDVLAAGYTSPSLDGELNWWGSATGPGPAGPGSGVGVDGLVDFDPWLCYGVDTAPGTPGFQPKTNHNPISPCDLTPPVLTRTYEEVGVGPYTPGTWATHTVKVRIACEDPLPSSGLVGDNDNVKVLVYQFSSSGIFPIPQPSLICEDNAGNTAIPLAPPVGSIKVDVNNPTCTPLPSSRTYTRNNAMVLVSFSVLRNDATFGGGPTTLELLSVTGNDGAVAGVDFVIGDEGAESLWDTGANDTSGNVKRARIGSKRTYTITWEVTDQSGRTGTCTAKVYIQG
jgi:nitrous oxidase accessory protein NosD